MKFRLFPQERAGLAILTTMAQQNVAAVQTLAEMFGSARADLPRLAEQIRGIDFESSTQQYALLTHLRSSFISTLPREDSFELSRLLNEIAESISSAAELMTSYQLERIPQRCIEALDSISRCAELSVNAMRGMDDLDGLEDYWIEILRLSKRARTTMRVFLGEQVEHVKAGNYLKYRELVTQLETITNNYRRLANKVGAIIVKES